ncbi:hypothetical protein DFP86_102289 [Paludibacterium purpuratum]|uniref:Uncharacterized protein n=1 Tax=Paludibacterium purpuratum TaxID=1144873 RepID=A0A4R7BDV7_9NEIS|nr:hypothetical protein DFP86_102289 [Paludibacterium purpuratum]
MKARLLFILKQTVAGVLLSAGFFLAIGLAQHWSN